MIRTTTHTATAISASHNNGINIIHHDQGPYMYMICLPPTMVDTVTIAEWWARR